MAAKAAYPGRYLNPEKVEAQGGGVVSLERLHQKVVIVFFNGMFKVACPPGSVEEGEQMTHYKQGYHITKNEYRVSDAFLNDRSNYNS